MWCRYTPCFNLTVTQKPCISASRVEKYCTMLSDHCLAMDSGLHLRASECGSDDLSVGIHGVVCFATRTSSPRMVALGKGFQSPHCTGGIPLYRTRYQAMSRAALQRFALYLLPPLAHTHLPHRASGSVIVPPSTKSFIWRATPA
jgi:hypothetical protein